ncbi:MAG: sensor histidine kinase [Pseudomonadota bacterium]
MLDSVRRGLILVILIAIAPIASASMVQGVLQLRRATEEAQHRLLQGATTGAASQQNIFASAENVLQALKNVPGLRSDSQDCAATLYGATLSLPFASNIAFIDADGRVTCSALTQAGTDMSQRGWWQKAKADKSFTLGERQVSPVTRSEIMVGTLPLYNAQSDFIGALSIAIDAGWLDNLLKRETPSSAGVAALFDASGQQLVSNSPAVSRRLFAGKDLSAYVGKLGETEDVSGRSWSFAVATLERHNLLLAYAQPSDELFQWTTFHVAVSFILPIFMVIFTVVAIWLATDRMVLQWLLYLRRVTAVYGQGHYGFRPSRMDQAPSEFRVLGHAIEDMALAIRERDAKLREGLAEKTALVREIHHRVKNSLQVVVSLLSLYGSGVRGEADRARFDQLRIRINTLAVVHRILYEASEGSQVQILELLRELSALLEASLDRTVLITVEADEVVLPTDLAGPLALLLTEIVMAMGRATTRPPLKLAIKGVEEGGFVVLSLTAAEDVREDLGEARIPLAYGFTRQIGGALDLHAAGAGCRADVRFSPRFKTR